MMTENMKKYLQSLGEQTRKVAEEHKEENKKEFLEKYADKISGIEETFPEAKAYIEKAKAKKQESESD